MDHAAIVRRAVGPDAGALLAFRTAPFEETEYMLWEPGEFKNTAEDERNRIRRRNGGTNSLCLVAAELVGFLNAIGGQVRRQSHSRPPHSACSRAGTN